MMKILQEQFPEAQLITEDNSLVFHQDDHIIFLYADAIGLGWSRLEKKYMTHIKSATVLNGRKRRFLLNNLRRRGLMLRRFLEVTFLPEIIFSPFLLIYGSLLVVKDKIMGRV
jgi:hypothetical protein